MNTPNPIRMVIIMISIVFFYLTMYPIKATVEYVQGMSIGFSVSIIFYFVHEIFLANKLEDKAARKGRFWSEGSNLGVMVAVMVVNILVLAS